MLNPDFEQTLRKYYQPETKAFDISNASTCVTEMNNWLKRATDGAIQQVVSESDIDELSLGFLLNAFVLDAEWHEYFKEVGKRPFYPKTGAPRPIPMLQQTRIFAYADATIAIAQSSG